MPFSPIDIRFETMRSFGGRLSSLAGERTLILASEGTLERLKANESLQSLIGNKKNRVISGITPNPSVDDVCRNLNELRHEDAYSVILAIGGGSCIDLAKAISALRGLAVSQDVSYEEVTESIRQKSFFRDSKPADIIAVPTTAGTGSEVTRWATVWDFKNKKKLSVEHQGCFPKAAIIVPELTMSMPQRVTLSTGLDALSHAMEAFWAKARTPLSQALALDAISRVKQFLPAALKDGGDLSVREGMCTASLLAGLAFSVTKTTACHSISYPLTMNYNIAHGFAAALTLSPVMAVNESAVPEIREIYALFEGPEGFDNWMVDVTAGIQELKLSAFGVSKAMIDSIAEGAFTLGRMDNNPVPLTREAVKEILEGVL